MVLDEAFATETLKTSYRDWTPQMAESVMRHFLGPWWHKANCAEMRLREVLFWMTGIMTYGTQIQRLREEAAMYLEPGFTEGLATRENCFTADLELDPHPEQQGKLCS